MSKLSTQNTSLQRVGRDEEILHLQACLRAGKNLLLEGPVGVGKTHLVLTALQELEREHVRVDGDGRYTEQKLSGGFDPPTVVQKGFVKEAFIAGPLIQAMEKGAVLFINEMNRLPESVQNVLLTALDERTVQIPHLGRMIAKPGFQVIATQNPKEFVATSHLSEAILDRFEWLKLDYQTAGEELKIVSLYTEDSALAEKAVALVRRSREHPHIQRGASVRAAIAIVQIAKELKDLNPTERLFTAAFLALPTRIEVRRDLERESHPEFMERLIRELIASGADESGKKKST